MDVNISGVYDGLRRYFLPAMVKRGSGVIVNFSSGGDGRPRRGGSLLHDEVGHRRHDPGAVQELPDGMAAVPLNPGVINTDMLQTAWGADAKSYPTPDQWAKRAVPLILGITGKDNGEPMAVRSN